MRRGLRKNCHHIFHLFLPLGHYKMRVTSIVVHSVSKQEKGSVLATANLQFELMPMQVPYYFSNCSPNSAVREPGYLDISRLDFIHLDFIYVDNILVDLIYLDIIYVHKIQVDKIYLDISIQVSRLPPVPHDAPLLLLFGFSLVTESYHVHVIISVQNHWIKDINIIE